MSRYHIASRTFDRVAVVDSLSDTDLAATHPEKLYHGTTGRNAHSVTASGIIPSKGTTNFKGISKSDSVYLTDSENAAADWVYNAYVDGSAETDRYGNATASVFVVDTAALNPRLLSADFGGDCGDWRYAGEIPPSALQLVAEHDYTDDVEKECEECGQHPWNCMCE